MSKRNQPTRTARRQRQRQEQRSRPAAAVGFAQRVADAAAALFAGSQPGERWRYVPYLLLAAFAARAAVALWGDFVLHPDEIMQYLEPAHYAAFGNGVLYWEYLHGARSWLIPGAVAGVLKALDAVGLAQPGVYVAVVKLLFCALSLLIPWAMYRFTRITVNEPAARVALVFGCFWYELVALAHKPFTEFVSAAVLMAALALSVGARAERNGRVFSIGMLAALGGAIRLQYAPLALVLLLLRMVPLRAGGRVWLWAGALLVTVGVGVIEWLTWGAPFHSYLTNFFVNIELDEGRIGESSRWLLLGQLAVASGGGALIAFAAAVGKARRRPLILLLSVLLLALHLLPEHREYRFLYLLIPLWLMLLAAFIGGGFGGSGGGSGGDGASAKQGKGEGKFALMRRGAVATVLGFGALALLNVLPWQNWVYKSFSKEKGAVQYLRNQDPMFDVLKFLARQDDVSGVLYHAHNTAYFNTGGYYYLHHDIPFYSTRTWGEANRQRPETTVESLVSHVVTAADIQQEQMQQFEEVRREGDLVVWRRRDNSQPVVGWRERVVNNTTQWQNDLVADTIRRVRAIPLLGWFVVDCPPGAPESECLYWDKAPPLITLSEE